MSLPIPGTELVWAWPLAWLLLPLPLLVHRFAPAREPASGRALRVPALDVFESRERAGGRVPRGVASG